MAASTSLDVAGIVARLKEREAALGDPLDVPRSTHAFEQYWKERHALSAAISGLTNASDDLNRSLAHLGEREEHRAAVAEKFALVEKELAEAADCRMCANAHARDREYERQRDLRLQLQRLHEGTLLLAPGVVTQRLSDIEAHIAELQRRITMLRAQLAQHVQEAETLLGAGTTPL